MAREAAHQMGTPLMSLEGWIEQLRSRPTPPPGLADYLSSDAERLERVAQRFERIGRDSSGTDPGLGALAGRSRHISVPLPHRANPIELRVAASGTGPVVRAIPFSSVGAGVAGQEQHRRDEGPVRIDYRGGGAG
jgi:signal transduction histidine kinase